MPKFFSRTLLAAALACAGVNNVSAGTATGTMAVTLTLTASCVVVPTPLAFGTLGGVLGSNTDATATIVVTCTPGTAFAVTLDNGQYASSGQRRLQGLTTTNYVSYNLYTDSGRTTSWSGATSQTGTGIGTFTVYGRVPTQSGTAIDVYADAVTVTATY